MAIETLFIGGHFDGKRTTTVFRTEPPEVVVLTGEDGIKKYTYKLFTRLGFSPEVRIYVESNYHQSDRLTELVILRLAKGYNPIKQKRGRPVKSYGAEKEKRKEVSNECR